MTLFKQPVLLFGTSANPLHAGHIHVMHAVQQATQIHDVHILIAPTHSLKAGTGYLYLPEEHRLALARLMTQHDASLIVSDFELLLQLTQEEEESRTRMVLRAWRKAHPNLQPVWVMGADSWRSFHLWQGKDEIIGTMPMVIVNRGDIDCTKTDAALEFAHLHQPSLHPSRAGWTVLPIQPHSASATRIREALAANQLPTDLTPEAADYIRQHNLQKYV